MPEDQEPLAISSEHPVVDVVEGKRPGWMRRHPVATTAIGTTAVLIGMVIGLWSKRDDFTQTFSSASAGVLAVAIGTQVLWLVARSEAWHVCVEAAGGRVDRRRLYRASALGYLGNILNANIGLGLRIAALRRSAPDHSPSPKVLIAAELPIVVIEMALAALLCFTLISPLGIPWWVAVAILVGMASLIGGAGRFVRDRRHGFWQGLDVLRGLRGRNTIIALVMFATGAQVVRNYVLLRAVGVDVSVLDCIALLIATAAVGLLPIGPTLGATTAVLILGRDGVAVVAAAGALLTATGAMGSLLFAGWALGDRLRPGHRPLPAREDPEPPEGLPTTLSPP